MKSIFIAGVTGSIGENALNILRSENNFFLKGFTAHSNKSGALSILKEFNPEFAIITKKDTYEEIIKKTENSSIKTKIFFGIDEACNIIENEKFDIVLNAIVGGAGLKITHSTVNNQKRLALANKESLVIGGEIIIAQALSNKCEIIPVDSEHSAIFQCLFGEKKSSIKKLWLTASGGPFFKRKEGMENITVKQALAHPNWSMGAKISIDSATMMNKGLEVIEAHHLFNIDYNNIYVAIHPESIVHSMVEFVDGNFIAQMGPTDMKGPIKLSFTYPERTITKNHNFDLFKNNKLNFHRPDFKRFPLLSLAYNAGKEGAEKCVILNSANEAAVSLFLQEKISFNNIYEIIDTSLNSLKANTKNIEEIIHSHNNIYNKIMEEYNAI